MKWYLLILLLYSSVVCLSQDTISSVQVQRYAVKDTLVLDTAGINPSGFEIKNKLGQIVDTTWYQTDYKNGWVIFTEISQTQTDSVDIQYRSYPRFLTKRYFQLDPSIIVTESGSLDKLYSLEETNFKNTTSPFDGLNTLGSITRGITIGNNQNAVVNSELDLQITGKLSDKVSIRASIQDANIPAQEGGYSQSLDEFDQIFIELYGDQWNIRAGDVDLQNTTSYFSKFTKKVQGISLQGTMKHKDGSTTNAFASGALVRGVFQQSNFVGQEGNQGPYKLVGPNGELFILIVSGSERVYINGLLLSRGENEDYVIDYNAGEIKFNPTYPITSNMRIRVEYQFTDRNYTRFIGYGGGNYSSDTFDIGAYVYSENDAKNQPLQQSLSEEQVAILSGAGDNQELMNAPSAVEDTFSENKILYRKEEINGEEVFVFSNDPTETLFNVRFTMVGDNMGDYVLSEVSTINRVFEYIPTINGVSQGNFAPIVRLSAPVKLQLAGVQGNYHPSEKTSVAFEISGSANDLNLFSSLDNDDNQGFAGHVAANQRILTTKDTLKVNTFASADFVNADFRNIERLYNVEFNRDWNLETLEGNQRLIIAGSEITHPTYGRGRYEFQSLNYSENFQGARHVLNADVRLKSLHVALNGSALSSESNVLSSNFSRGNATATYAIKKSWVGIKTSIENNQIKAIANDSLSPLSQKYNAYEVFTGIGDSTKIYGKVGYRYRENDSVRNNLLQRVNTSHDYYAQSQVIQTQQTQLSVFANYRVLNFDSIPGLGMAKEAEKTLNTRLLYAQSLLKNGVRFNTAIESNSGVIAQQEFTYLQVDAGQGVYTWIDYNNNEIQELNEFEVAQFQDEALYVRILLPNQVFTRIRNNKFSQILTLNPQQWINETGFKKLLSKFYNQTSYVIDRKVKRSNDLGGINPFKDGKENQLGLNLNFRNALFFNRGKQNYSTSYTYISSAGSNLISLGLQESKLKSHQLNFNHKVNTSWLVNFKGAVGSTESISENFENRNFDLDTYQINPKISYLLNRQTRFDVFYQLLDKQNLLGELEQLEQQKIGTSFAYTNAQKISISGEINYIDNKFKGSAFSPVAYTMLEGLQPGTNFTWNLLFQKRITKYLDANLSYIGRKSESTNAVHTGTVQLRAYF